MAIRRQIMDMEGIFFITFTCFEWLNLFEITNSYDAVYKWFDFLKKQGHFITGYVIMPNHLHALIAFRAMDKILNIIIGNGKRFIAYEIVKRLKKGDQKDLLQKLSLGVCESDKKRGKLHQVFESSFDGKKCWNEKFIEQKLAYIHNNPCRGKWNLAVHPTEYIHSSARFYYTGEQGVYPVTNYKDLMDIDLTGQIE